MKRLSAVLAVLVAALASPGIAPAQSPAPSTTAPAASTASGSILLTVFLKHDQSKTLEEIQAHVEKTGFRKTFPPEGTEVVGWYVMMGIGQVVILRVPPDKLRAVNLAIERGAWGAYRSEFYATYDYLPIFKEQREKAMSASPGK